jgi:hypothetical protein
MRSRGKRRITKAAGTMIKLVINTTMKMTTSSPPRPRT